MEWILLIVFIIGYALIVLEHNLGFDKAASALLTGIILWSILVLHGNAEETSAIFLHDYLPQIAGILLFLIGAMTIVEVIDQHEGFQVIATMIGTSDKRKLIWIIGWITFFLSSILDNLTTAIVMISLLKKLVDEKEERMLFAGIVIIAANAGGAWSTIGDITTTMLWIGGQITTLKIIRAIFLPSIVCLFVPLIAVSFQLKGKVRGKKETEKYQNPKWVRVTILLTGIVMLLFVPVFKTITHLPPFMGMLFSLGVLWLLTDILHKEKEEKTKKEFSVYKALSRIDVPSTLFFFGILSAVAAMEQAELLKRLATHLDHFIGNNNLIVYAIGLLSAIVDNVPLVAATQGMYTYPTDHHLWHYIAYCAGTGGSILIIGSAAGVAIMGIEKINFMWYARKIGWLALIGYTAGALLSVLESSM